MQATYQTLIKCENDAPYVYFTDMAMLFSRLERKLFVDCNIRGRPWAELKKKYIAKYQITARQFNSVFNSLAGKVQSVKEGMKFRQQDVAGRITSAEKFIKEKEKAREKIVKRLKKLKQGTKDWQAAIEKVGKIKFSLHQKKRRLRNLCQRLDNLKKDIDKEKYRICFGSRKLFKAQHNLEQNGYKDHAKWLKAWRGSRSSSFFVIGSKDETFGNQTCTYAKDNTLRIRVANEFTKEFGKYISISNVVFPYGQEQLNKAREPVRIKTPKGTCKKEYKAISYRFVRRNSRWYLYATVEREDPVPVTSKWNGAVGIDINDGFLAVCEIDRFGNPLGEFKIPVAMRDRSTDQIEAALGDAIKEAMSFARLRGKSVVIEDLDFNKKKQALRENGSGYSRMLSGLTYKKFQEMMTSATAKEAVELVKPVNPFATSVIGQLKFMVRYGLSSHGSAACVIARRGMGFKMEKAVGSDVIKLPERKRTTRGNYWRRVCSNLKKIRFSDRVNLLYTDKF